MKNSLIRRTFVVAVIFLAALKQTSADTLDIWRWRSPLPNASSVFNLQFLNGQFVGLGFPSGLITSPDGTNWNALPLPAAFDFNATQIAYGNGQYVLVGNLSSGSTIATSPDLLNWTFPSAGASHLFSCVTFGDGRFVAGGGAAPLILTSSNGVDWSQTSTQEIDNVTYGNGHFVAALGNIQGQVLVSEDGIGWTPITITSGNVFSSGSFANDRFYEDGFHNISLNTIRVLYSSTDGLNWSPASDPRTSGSDQFHAVFGNGILLGSTTSGILCVSTNATNFVAIAANNFSGASSIAFGNGVFVNGSLQTSLDATNWSASPIFPTNTGYSLVDLIYGTNGYIAVSKRFALIQSPNSLGFSFLTNTIPVGSPRIKSAAGIYLAVGTNGALALSTNELDWFPRNSASSGSLNDIEYGASTWVAVGADGIVTTSSTGNTWSLRTSGTSQSLNGIAYGTNLFVIVGNNGTILTSQDGLSWSPQFGNIVTNLNKITYGNGQFVAVGAHGTVITSSDGTNWTSQTSGTQEDLGDIAFGEGTFCAVSAGGQPNLVVITSSNAVFWKLRQTDALSQLSGGATAGVRYLNGTFFVFSDNRVLQSGPITPPRLQLSLDDGIPDLTVQSSSNLLLRIQSTDNLIGPWQDLGLFTNSTGSFIFPDDPASGHLQHFYRTSVP